MVILHDAARKRESEPPAAGLGRESRFEDTLPVPLGDALAGILDVDHHVLVVRRDAHVDRPVPL